MLPPDGRVAGAPQICLEPFPSIETRLCEMAICTLSQKHFAPRSCFKKEKTGSFGVREFLKSAIEYELKEHFFNPKLCI